MFLPSKDTYQFEPGTGGSSAHRLHTMVWPVHGAQIPTRGLVRQREPFTVWCAASLRARRKIRIGREV